MSTNLISLERALRNLPGATAADERTIDAMIGACSDAIRKHCRRDFALREYDELYDGFTEGVLLLRAYPLHSVESVRVDPRPVLRVRNSSADVQQARVTVTATGLTLVRVAAGVRASDTSVTWAAQPTLSAVAAAVNALGNGWSAEATAAFAALPAQDLSVAPSFGDATRSEGALACRDSWAELHLHVVELSDYHWNPRGWLYLRGGDCGDTLLSGSVRVQYTAGYAEVPQAVQEACAAWVAELFHRTRRDPGLATLALVGSLSQTWTRRRIPVAVAGLLAPYRRISIG